MATLQWVKSGNQGDDTFKLKQNGEFFTDSFAPELSNSIVNIAAYDAAGNIVTATVGTITISSSPISEQWIDEPTEGDNVINLSECGADSTYNMPLYNGPSVKFRAVLDSVNFTEVDHVKVRVWGV